MISYTEIRDYCTESSRLSRLIIDDMLISYAAQKNNLEHEMKFHLKKYRKTAVDINKKYINYLMSEYIAHRIFKKNGLIANYLKQKPIMNIPKEHYNFLVKQAEYPWRFSFAVIKNNPDDSFYVMDDVFTGEEYLLFSPGMKAMEQESQPIMWFNLIAFNGKCWQTFGLIIPFQAFLPDDIFFFATEINPQINDDESLINEVEKNPWPFFMLINSSTTPMVVSRKEEIRLMHAVDYPDEFNIESLKDTFIIENKKNVSRMALHDFGSFPHFAVAYYNRSNGELLRSAMTQKGFDKLTAALNSFEFALPAEAEIAVSPAMLNAASNILNRKINLNRYEALFHVPASEKESENLDRINHFIKLALPYYNEGKEIDVREMSNATGLDEEGVLSIWNNLKKNVKG